ncbi:hypothetical protein [Bacillus albus]|uniref:hypothetical protein n=1 Tax=Bacillus albus TaxID=2026189 RepID=UPI0030158498
MGMLSKFSRQKLKEEDYGPQTNDVLIIFDDEKRTSDIKRINMIQENKVMVIDEYVVPVEDCVITNSAMGRNFFYRAPTQSIVETKRLAQLEQSMVLTKITNYKPKPPESNINIMNVILSIVIIVFIIVFGAVSCSNGKAQQQEVPTQSYQKSDK